MKDFEAPIKPDCKFDMEMELRWRQEWKAYNELFESIQTDHRIRLLLKWFKEDFFLWVNGPKCLLCKVLPCASHLTEG
jgi:hypothetical protein